MARRKPKLHPRQRRPQAHDRRHLYHPAALPKHAQIAAVEIEDPYAQAGRISEGNLDVTARLEPARHRDGSTADGAPGWTPPARPTITVVRSLKDDPLGRMHARRQVDDAAYHAGREYQELVERAGIDGAVRSVDLDRPVIDRRPAADRSLTDGQRRAFRRLRNLDGDLALRHGAEALALMRAVLIDKTPVEKLARAQGVTSNREIRHWGWAFRRALNALAVLLGFAGKAPGARAGAIDKWTLMAVGTAVRAAGA